MAKGDANRPIEPYMWHTVVTSATDWINFFALRTAVNSDGIPMAHLGMHTIAEMMETLYNDSEPTILKEGEWHLPYITAEEREQYKPEICALVSAGRCAGVSYLRHGESKPFKEALGLAVALAGNGHWSPLEHQAKAMGYGKEEVSSGNFYGFKQFRKFFKNENITAANRCEPILTEEDKRLIAEWGTG